MISKRILTAELRGMRAGRHGRASVSHPRGRLRRGADPWLGHPALARQERAGPLQPTPRIAPVVGVFRNPGHRKWMQRLQQQCPQPADKHQTSVCTRRIGRSRRTSGGGGRCPVDASPIGRPLRPGNHAEQAATQVLPHRVPGYVAGAQAPGCSAQQMDFTVYTVWTCSAHILVQALRYRQFWPTV